MSAPFLVVNNLGVTFPTEDGLLQAVDDVSFSLEKGRTLAIVGESGSGKSVTSQAIMGLHNRKAVKVVGEVILDGQELVNSSDQELRAVRGKKMAMIFQDPLSSLHPYYTIGKQLVEARLVHADESKDAARRTGDHDAGPGRHPERGAADRRLPPPALRRACASGS